MIVALTTDADTAIFEIADLDWWGTCLPRSRRSRLKSSKSFLQIAVHSKVWNDVGVSVESPAARAQISYVSFVLGNRQAKLLRPPSGQVLD